MHTQERRYCVLTQENTLLDEFREALEGRLGQSLDSYCTILEDESGTLGLEVRSTQIFISEIRDISGHIHLEIQFENIPPLFFGNPESRNVRKLYRSKRSVVRAALYVKNLCEEILEKTAPIRIVSDTTKQGGSESTQFT